MISDNDPIPDAESKPLSEQVVVGQPDEDATLAIALGAGSPSVFALATATDLDPIELALLFKEA